MSIPNDGQNGGAAAAGAAAGAAGVVAAGGQAAPNAGVAGAPATGAGGAAAAPTPWHTEFFKPDGAINREVFGKMPEQFRGLGEGELKNIQTAEQLMAKVHGLATLAGRKALAPLPADAKPEDVAAHQATIRAVLGVPEKPEGYGITRPDDLPAELWDESGAKQAMEIAHKHNVSPGAMKELIALQTQMARGSLAAQQQYEQEFYAGQEKAWRESLQKDGLDVDKTNALVGQVATQFGLPADSPLLKNAAVRSILQKVGVAMGESKFVGGKGNTDLKSDRAIADDIVHNKQNPDYEAYWKPEHAKHQEVKKRVMAHYEAAAKMESAAAR